MSKLWDRILDNAREAKDKFKVVLSGEIGTCCSLFVSYSVSEFVKLMFAVYLLQACNCLMPYVPGVTALIAE